MLSVFFFSSKCSLFHNSNIFGSHIIHILCTGCAKIKKNNSGAKRLSKNLNPISHVAFVFLLYSVQKPGTNQSLSWMLCLHTQIHTRDTV